MNFQPITLHRVDRSNWKIVKDSMKKQKLFIVNEATDLVNGWLKRKVTKIEGGENVNLDEKELKSDSVSMGGASSDSNDGISSSRSVLP